MYRFKLTILAVFFVLTGFYAQNTPFNIHLSPIQIEGVGGLQAFAFGQHQGKWLIVGGRLDGLHRRQPFASFDIAGHNNQLTIIDPVSNQSWTMGLSTLPAQINEAGFKIVAMKYTKLSAEKAGEFYAVHSARPFYGELVSFMSSGPIVAAILEKDNAVEDFRKLIGSTNPADAAPGTIRARFAKKYW